MPGMVAVDDRTNRAFVTNSADHTVSVLDAGNGTVLRTVALGDEPDVVAADVRTGRIFVLTDPKNTVCVLDAVTGALLRTVAVTTADLAVDDQTGRVFVSGLPYSGVGTVAMLDGRSGSMLHNAIVGGNMAWGVAVDARTRRVFVVNVTNDDVSVVDASSGRVLRTVAVGYLPVAVAVDVSTGHVFVTNSGADTVTMLDALTGSIVSTIKVGPNPGRVVVDERTGHVFVIHSRGKHRNSFTSDGPGGTTMLDARSGAVLRSVAVGGGPLDDVGYVDAINVAVDQRRGRVFVIDQTSTATLDGGTDGSVSVLDAGSGSLLNTLPVGRHPVALAVDETTARLFVVNTNSGCASRDAFGWIAGSVRQRLPFISQPPKPTCGMPGSVTVIDTSHL
jgi:YVTN family beta-propeller protein